MKKKKRREEGEEGGGAFMQPHIFEYYFGFGFFCYKYIFAFVTWFRGGGWRGGHVSLLYIYIISFSSLIEYVFCSSSNSRSFYFVFADIDRVERRPERRPVACFPFSSPPPLPLPLPLSLNFYKMRVILKKKEI